MPRLLGISLSTSSIWTLKSNGEMTPPWGTPAITWPTLDRAPGSLTCSVLPVKKLWVHFQNPRLTPEAASLVSRIAWSTRSNAFRKSTKAMCTPSVLQSRSVALNQSCVVHPRAVTVDLPLRNACWLSAISSSCLFRSSWNLSSSFATCGKTDICLKSLFISWNCWDRISSTIDKSDKNYMHLYNLCTLYLRSNLSIMCNLASIIVRKQETMI